MTSIIANMISVLNHVEPPPFNVSVYLGSEDEGERLAGYAYLYANPDPRLTQQIAAGLTKDKSFAQYWALRTLRRQIQADPACLDLNTKRNLEEMLKYLPPATDRAYELGAYSEKVLREVLSFTTRMNCRYPSAHSSAAAGAMFPVPRRSGCGARRLGR